MHTLFSISLNGGKIEFSLVGVADVHKKTAKFQAVCNGGVFFEGIDYEKVRSKLMDAVQLNQSNVEALN